MFKIIVSLAGIQFLQAVVQILKMKLVTLIMGTEGLGVISLLNQLMLLVIQTSTLALPWVATRFMAIGFNHGQEAFARQVKLFFRLILCLSVPGSIFAIFLVCKLDFFQSQAYGKFFFLSIVSLAMVVPCVLKSFILSVFATAGKFRFTAIASLVNVSLVTFSVLLGARYWGLNGFFVLQAVAEYMTLFYFVFKLRTELGIQPLKGKIDTFGELRKLHGSLELIAYGFILSFLAPAAQTIIRVCLFNFGGEAQVGVYQATHGLVLYITLALGQANNLYLDPIVKRDIPMDEKLKIAGNYFRTIVFILGGAMIIVNLFPEFILRLLYSKELIVASSFLFVVMFSEVINTASGVFVGLLVGQGWYKTHFFMGLIFFLSMGLIAYIATPQAGIWGVMAGLGVSSVLASIIVFARVFFCAGFLVPFKTFFDALIVILLATFSGFYVAGFERTLDWVPVGLPTRLMLLTFFFLVVFFLLSGEEKSMLRKKLSGIKAHLFKGDHLEI